MIRKLLLVLLCAAGVSAHAALDPAQVRRLAADDSADKVAAIRQLTRTADPDAARVLQAMADDALYVASDRALIITGEQAFDAATGAAVAMPAEPEAVTVNNRLRGELANALAALKLFDADPAVRRASAQALQASADLQKCGLAERKFSGRVPVLVKLQRPPPDIRIFLPALLAWSSSSTSSPRAAVCAAHIRPAAPAPMITTWRFTAGGPAASGP